MSSGFFSNLFNSEKSIPSSQSDASLDELRGVVRKQSETIKALQEELQLLRLHKEQNVAISKIWKPGPPSRSFNLSGIGFTCKWVLPSLREIPPELFRTFEVPSFDFDSSQVYHVSLPEHSCTCPDFSKRRQNLPLGHALRCCKHIIKVLEDTGLFQTQDDFTRQVLLEARDPEMQYLEIDFPQGCVFVGITPGKEWFDILAPKKTSKGVGELEWFGYDQAGKRWSYGKPPFNPVPIKEAINALLGGRSYA